MIFLWLRTSPVQAQPASPHEIAKEYCQNIEEVYSLLIYLVPQEKEIFDNERLALSEEMRLLSTKNKLTNLDLIILIEYCRSSVFVYTQDFVRLFNTLCVALLQDKNRCYESEKRTLCLVLGKSICFWCEVLEVVLKNFLNHPEKFYHELAINSLRYALKKMNFDQLCGLQERLGDLYDEGKISSPVMALFGELEEILRQSSLSLPWAGVDEVPYLAAVQFQEVIHEEDNRL